jgi:hypothetical protein
VLAWFERERLVALWMHGAATRAWVVRALTTVSLCGDGWIWYAIIAVLPWWGGPVGGSAAARMLGVGAVNLVLYKIVKRWIARPRPFRACGGAWSGGNGGCACVWAPTAVSGARSRGRGSRPSRERGRAVRELRSDRVYETRRAAAIFASLGGALRWRAADRRRLLGRAHAARRPALKRVRRVRAVGIDGGLIGVRPHAWR